VTEPRAVNVQVFVSTVTPVRVRFLSLDGSDGGGVASSVAGSTEAGAVKTNSI
jgi:hypothetical protein